nr:MAG TPA: hypothetical protein [Bacteriophage sp.]
MYAQPPFQNPGIDRTDPQSIYEYSRLLMDKSLHEVAGDHAVVQARKGKGGLGQMVEELFFGYEVNNNPEADFSEAGVELKCTPLLPKKQGIGYRIKEHLVCTMIDYFELARTPFEQSHLLMKCRLMLLLFYLHRYDVPAYDFKFLFRVLWELPEKDLLIIKQDYETIAEKVRRGEAHLLSEGDTNYLGACRKGQKGDSPQPQPFSSEKAIKRAFSLKPAYMRYILEHVVNTENGSYTNFRSKDSSAFELVDTSELVKKPFETIITERFRPFFGLNFIEICHRLNISPYQAKNKYADVSALIASNGVSKRLSTAEEFAKSGIVMKTVRLRANGMPRESMSFKNIDYQEIAENDEWIDSELYEIFTGRFMFVVFRPDGRTITMLNNATGQSVTEPSYVLTDVFFWTMPASDLATAQEYWEDIRRNVLADNINSGAFWKLEHNRKFHVRPKATNSSQLAVNPNGGSCPKYCYWFNAEYVKEIIDSDKNVH